MDGDAIRCDAMRAARLRSSADQACHFWVCSRRNVTVLVPTVPKWRREVPEICLLDSFGARWFYPFVHMSVGKKLRKVSCTSIMYLLPFFLVAGQPWPMSSVGTGTQLQKCSVHKWLITDSDFRAKWNA